MPFQWLVASLDVIWKLIVLFAPFHVRLSVCSSCGSVSTFLPHHHGPECCLVFLQVLFSIHRALTILVGVYVLPPFHSFPSSRRKEIGCADGHDLLPTREKYILLGHLVSHFSFRRYPPRHRCTRRNNQAHDGRVRLPVLGLAVPPTRRRPHVFRVRDFAASSHFGRGRSAVQEGEGRGVRRVIRGCPTT
jgi:hypothetical protein